MTHEIPINYEPTDESIVIQRAPGFEDKPAADSVTQGTTVTPAEARRGDPNSIFANLDPSDKFLEGNAEQIGGVAVAGAVGESPEEQLIDHVPTQEELDAQK